MTLRRTIARTLGHNLLVTFALAVVVLFSLTMQDKESVARPAPAGSAQGLVESHGCANQSNPTHSVVTIDGVTRYVGQRLTDRAIEQAMFGIEHGIKVHAFCA